MAHHPPASLPNKSGNAKAEAKIGAMATRAKRARLRDAAKSYRRARDLPGLVPIPLAWTRDLSNAAMGTAIRRRLRLALAIERIRVSRSPFGAFASRQRADLLRRALLGEFALARQTSTLRPPS